MTRLINIILGIIVELLFISILILAGFLISNIVLIKL